MSAETKLSLSAFEWEILCNPEWIYTKNKIMQRGHALFAVLAEKQRSYVESIPVIHELASPPPKISRGEQYKGLPYLMLDYPRIFSKDNVFAIRTMFWWGKYFSVTLHLKGSYAEMFKPAMVKLSKERLPTSDYYVQDSINEWEHDLDTADWTKRLIDLDYVEERELIKIAFKIELTKWEQGQDVLYESFMRFVNMLQVA